MAANRM